MPEHFFQLSITDRREALEVARATSGRPVHLLEKDIWVVWALETLCASAFAPQIVFKGGTSLSKAYGVIRRFSEDIDLTYDIRAIAPDLVAEGTDALPSTRSQEKRWSNAIKARLAGWVQHEVLPVINAALATLPVSSHARAEADRVYIDYEPLTSGTGYVRPSVTLEFGARSTGEPWEARSIVCDAAEHVPQLSFPAATPRVMRIERTFWEKATAIHVFCVQGRFRNADRFARHWHDIARLGETHHLASAIAARDVAGAVARHKAIFFREKDADGYPVDYAAVVSGGLRLVPDGAPLADLADDYHRMVDDGLLLEDAETFDLLMERSRRVEEQANAHARSSHGGGRKKDRIR